jgi:hypothetical protein
MFQQQQQMHQFMLNQMNATNNPSGNGPQNGNGNEEGQLFTLFRKQNPPVFRGASDPTEAEEWVMQLEKIFTIVQCTEVQKAKFAAFMLGGDAEHWWRTTQRIEEAEGRVPVTWTQFQEVFFKQYFPESVRDIKEEEFLKLQQEGMSVSEYDSRFQRYARFALHLVPDEYRRAKRFLNGLRPGIRQHLVPLKLQTYVEVLERALCVESDRERHFQSKNEKKRDRPFAQTLSQASGSQSKRRVSQDIKPQGSQASRQTQQSWVSKGDYSSKTHIQGLQQRQSELKGSSL